MQTKALPHQLKHFICKKTYNTLTNIKYYEKNNKISKDGPRDDGRSISFYYAKCV